MTKSSKGAILEKHGLILQEKENQKPENYRRNGFKTQQCFPKASSLKTSKCIKKSYWTLKYQQILSYCTFQVATLKSHTTRTRCLTDLHHHICLLNLILLMICFSQASSPKRLWGDNISPSCPHIHKRLKKVLFLYIYVHTHIFILPQVSDFFVSLTNKMSFVHFCSVFLQK